MRWILPATLLLATCQREPVESANAFAECAVTPEVQALVGKSATDVLVADARRLSGAKLVRRIEPGMAVTMDYRVDRLNVHVDGRGDVERVSCG